MISGHNKARRHHSCCAAIAPICRKKRIIWSDLARINRRVLPGTIGLNFLPNVRQRRVQFPPQSIVQRQIGSQLPTILRKQIERFRSNQFVLRGTLDVVVIQTQQVVRKKIVGNRIVRPASIDVIGTVDVEIEALIELIVTEVSAKFKTMISNNFSEAVGNLVRIPALRKLALKVVSNRKSAGNVNVRNSFPAGSEVRVDSEIGIVGVREAVARRDRSA